MEITQEAKLELKQIYLSQTGELLTDLQVEKMAQDLFCLFEVIYQPIPKNTHHRNTFAN